MVLIDHESWFPPAPQRVSVRRTGTLAQAGFGQLLGLLNPNFYNSRLAQLVERVTSIFSPHCGDVSRD